ncbi:MAG: DPP IV N-terminal domain-containing protein [Mangrovibacterium sp.]
MNIKNVCFKLLFFLSLVQVVKAQVSPADYALADSLHQIADRVYYRIDDASWIDETHSLWYRVNTREGWKYKMVRADKPSVYPAFNHERLAEAISSLSEKEQHADSLKLGNPEFTDSLKTIRFSLEEYNWECTLDDYRIKKTGKVKRPVPAEYWGASRDTYRTDSVASPDSSRLALIREYNLFVKDLKTGKTRQLSFDGSSGDYYSAEIAWSPDSKKIALCKIRSSQGRKIYFVESSPENQLQPVLHQREYLKPGDALPIRRPCLFLAESGKKIPIDSRSFLHQYALTKLKWRPDSRAFTFEFNQRGHQLYQIAEVNARSGELRVLVNEQSETFIDYSGKYYRYDLDKTGEIIWASERDGWNHLYLIDARSGLVKNQITRGNWVVRGVEQVDEKNRKIIFRASGKNRGEDPYFIHYYSVNLDGSGLKDLSPEPLNHHAVFSADFSYFTDTYSTIDTPARTVLRRSSDGKVLIRLEQEDITDLQKYNWKTPEVFVAKGRDGKTDIWGNIYYPTSFDPRKSYPVIEYIYAGPQDSYTPKKFQPYFPAFSGLAELGFIIVQMDGMGTSNRSKAFHDVCYKNLKDAGFPDRIRWIKAAAKKHSFMDTTRIGLFGGSAGGQNALAGVLFHPEFYKAASASCGCHDNRMDKMWWNEQWMGYPIEKQYEECSNVANAWRLQGKLLLIVGEMDDNVDPASTMQVANALIKAKKDFELVVLPGSNHTLGGNYGERKRRDFFVKTFYGQLAPDWNKKTGAALFTMTSAGTDKADKNESKKQKPLPVITAPPRSLNLDPFYRKYADANGIPIVSSWRVPDSALVQAWSIIMFMTNDLPSSVLEQMQKVGARVGVMARYEGTTDLPEHARLANDTTLNWDLRARGLGGDMDLPLTTCAEENLLCYQIDKYHAEDILIHEFAHAIHLIGIAPDTTFNKKLQQLLDNAVANRKYDHTYAQTDIYEYWAEGVQNWFNVNAEVEKPDGKHNQVNTREELKEYDPGLYDLIRQYFSEFEGSPSCHAMQDKYHP